MQNQNRPTPNQVILSISKKYGLKPEDLTRRFPRSHKTHSIRNEAIAGIYDQCRRSYPQTKRLSLQRIGEIMGGRTHTTIRHALKMHKLAMENSNA